MSDAHYLWRGMAGSISQRAARDKLEGLYLPPAPGRGIQEPAFRSSSGSMEIAEQNQIAKADPATGPAPAGTSRRLRPLLALWPYMRRYRGRVIGALVALCCRLVGDACGPAGGAADDRLRLQCRELRSEINSYFAIMIAVVAVLAVASALRYYLVTTLGERIVADLRNDVFAHLTALSPAFFDAARTGEMVSRLTADTTQIKSTVGASASIALRNLVLFAGAAAMMVVTSPKLSGFVLAAIPLIVLPLVAFGRWVRRLSRGAQDTLADASAYAAEMIGAVRTLQAFTNERPVIGRFGQRRRSGLHRRRAPRRGRAPSSPRSRSSSFSPASSSFSGTARMTCCRARSRRARSASSCFTPPSPPARSAN